MSEPKFCMQCGAGLDPGDVFCASCGKQLTPAAPPAVQPPSPAPAPPMPGPPPAGQPQPAVVHQPPPPVTAAGPRRTSAAVWIVPLVLIIVVGLGYFCWKNYARILETQVAEGILSSLGLGPGTDEDELGTDRDNPSGNTEAGGKAGDLTGFDPQESSKRIGASNGKAGDAELPGSKEIKPSDGADPPKKDPLPDPPKTEVIEELSEAEREIAYYLDFVKQNPGDASAYFDLADIYYIYGYYDEAISAYRETIRLDPSWAWPHYSLGEVYFELGMTAEAGSQFQQATQKAPGDPYLLETIGMSYFYYGDSAKAIEYLWQAIRIDKEVALFHLELGEAYLDIGDYTNAQQAFYRTLELSMPGDFEYDAASSYLDSK